LGQAEAAKEVEEAVIKVVKKKLKTLSAGKMGYSTTEVGDLVVEAIG
jgi:3-isopropylmalate dehydrogenase